MYWKHCLLKVLHRLMNISPKLGPSFKLDHVLLLMLMQTDELDSPTLQVNNKYLPQW